MGQLHDPTVVVGVDGSRAATMALDVAVTEALLRQHPLHIVHATDAPTSRDEILLTARSRAEGNAPGLPVTCASVPGSPSRGLGRSVGDSDVLVVGARGLGGVGSILLGSTSGALVRHARCPVIVAHDRVPPTTGHVVVGVGGNSSTEALGFAFDEASRRRAELLALHAWDKPLAGRQTLLGSPSEIRQQHMAAEEEVLHSALDPWQAKYPSVRVRCVVSTDQPAAALIPWSATAVLVVVGRGPSGGPVQVGSTPHALLRRSTCPVAVVPAA
jgi:nucleotide-binding universal stress UspA family protein